MQTVDLSVIGNGSVAALIDGRGQWVWSCWPGLDGDPLFCGLLADEPEGVFAVELDEQVSATRVSAPDAAVVVTRLEDRSGAVVEVCDLAPTGEEAPAELIRILRPVAGRATLRLRFDPRADWGARRPTLDPVAHGVRLVGTHPTVRVTSDAADTRALLLGQPLVLERPVHVVLGADRELGRSAGDHAAAAVARTEGWWRAWFAGLRIPEGCGDVVRPAARALKLCCSRRTGGVVAALTSSLPEEPGTGRNWDYRYCWLRDAYFTVRALARLGDAEAVEGFGRWLEGVLGRTDNGVLQPLYGLGGETRIEERVAPALPGYRGHGPVRVGNAAYHQVQNDVFGQAVLCAELAGRPVSGALRGAADRAWDLWDQPDAGVWEYRDIAHTHTSSAAFCFAALQGMARLSSPSEQRIWQERADQVREGLLRRAWCEELRALSGAFDTPLLDASVLLLPQLGVLEWTDPRFLATVDTLDRRLLRTSGGHAHMMRYITTDDFGEPTHAFTACSFWAIQALVGVGRRAEALARFEDLLSRRSVAGLLSEDLDPSTGEGWGNYPQTYCSVGLVECALDLGYGGAAGG